MQSDGSLPAPTWIAEERVMFVYVDGARTEGRIALGAPVVLSAEEARCPAVVEGLEDSVHWVRGRSTFNALARGAHVVAGVVSAFREDGGRVLRAGTTEDVDLDELLPPRDLLIEFALERRGALLALATIDEELAVVMNASSIPMKWRRRVAGVRERVQAMVAGFLASMGGVARARDDDAEPGGSDVPGDA